MNKTTTSSLTFGTDDTRAGTVTHDFDTDEVNFKANGQFNAKQGTAGPLYFTRGWMVLPIAAFDPAIPRDAILVAARLLDDWAAEGDVIGSGMALILSMSAAGYDARDFGDNGSASLALFNGIREDWTPNVCVTIEPLNSVMEFGWGPFPKGLATRSPLQQAISQHSIVTIGCYCGTEGDFNGGFRASPEDPWPIVEIDWLPGRGNRRICLPPTTGDRHRHRRRR